MNGFSTFERLRSAVVLVATCVLVGAPLYGADRPITIGVVIDEATPKEREPLRAYLMKAMGRPVDIEAPDTFSDTVAHLGDGSYDFACLGALSYIRAQAKYGVIPLVQRVVDLHYHTVFITGTESSIYSLGDLRESSSHLVISTRPALT
jgi:phosphonate transport system substrate-binding protein